MNYSTTWNFIFCLLCFACYFAKLLPYQNELFLSVVYVDVYPRD